jgi:4-hydroxy-tetrahydrodipicolinate reductase
MIKIGFIGYGKMGQSIAKLLQDRADIRFIVDPADSASVNSCSGVECYESSLGKIPQSVIDDTDIVIEFTSPDTAKSNVLGFIQKKKNAKIISGSTGWDVKEIEGRIKEQGAVLLYSSNYSIGVNLVWNVLQNISERLAGIKEFQAAIVEYHHSEKKDSPSGTAKTMQELMQKQGVTAAISSVRCGHFPGTHVVSFDSPFETIEIKHEARNRDVFSLGVVNSLNWVAKQKTPGLYYFKDILEAI